jgi:hypothetical protein
MSKEDYELQPVVLLEITLKRTIFPDGKQGFAMDTPEEFSFLEALGLMEVAKWKLHQQMTQLYGG